MYFARPARLLPLAFLLAACGGAAAPSPSAPASSSPAASAAKPQASAQPSTSAAAAQKVTFKSAYTTTSATVTPLWGAKEGGFLDKEGLDVSLSRIAAGAPILSALQGGDVPLAIVGGQQIVEADLKGAQFVLVAGFVDTFAQSIWVVPSIQKPEQLKGAALAVTNFGSISHLAGRIAAEKLGLSGQVNFIAAGGPPEALAAIQTGKVQGAVLSPPDTLKARAAGLHQIADVATMGVKSQTAAIATQRTYVKEHPDVVERFVRAVILGNHRVKTDREFGEATISKYTKTDDKKQLDETYEYYKDIWGKDGFPNLKGIQQNIDSAAENIPEAKSAKPEQFVDTTFVQKIKDSGLIEQLWGKA